MPASNVVPRRVWTLALVVAAVAAVMAGCAKPALRLPNVNAPWLADLDRAHALVRDGCYTCLEEAAAIYERAVGLAPDRTEPRRQLVDTLILMAARERELGLGKRTSLQRAQAAASVLPLPWDYDTLLAIVQASGWNARGVSPAQQEEQFNNRVMAHTSWKDWRVTLLRAAPFDLTSQHLLAAFDCNYRMLFDDAGIKPWSPEGDVYPLVEYRIAACEGNEGRLDGVLKRVPRFGEAHLYLGEVALTNRKLRTAERHLLEAVEALPELAAGYYQLGQVYALTEEFDLAHWAYGNVLAAVPDHRFAMLEDAKALTYLKRPEEAIAIVNEMIRLGTWYLGEAHYWRAWNRYHLGQYDTANDDVVKSRQWLIMNPGVAELTGLIALARNEVERAEGEFRAAMELTASHGERNCNVAYYLPSVLVMQRKWAEGAPLFVKAEACLVEDERETRGRLAEIQRADLPADRQVRLVTVKEKQIAGLQAQQQRSAFNAAVAYVNMGQPDQARPLAERAASLPELATQVKALLARISKSPTHP
jgi:tetratricopeptide (TPR) repeat protein